MTRQCSECKWFAFCIFHKEGGCEDFKREQIELF